MKPTRAQKTCSIDGCESPALARTWCSKHWQRWKHHGDPSAEVRRLYAGTPEERFWQYANKTEDCWLWTGGTDRNGYGRLQVGTRAQTKVMLAHRFAYELLVGPIPEPLGLDHRYTCEKRCVNPAHLRPATQKQNVENQRPGPRRDNRASGIRNVYWDRPGKRWYVKVTHRGREHWGGYHTNLDSADRAARSLRNRLFTHNDADRIIE